jgi:hypothetical protein
MMRGDKARADQPHAELFHRITALALVDKDWPATSPPIPLSQNVFDYIRINTSVCCFTALPFAVDATGDLPVDRLKYGNVCSRCANGDATISCNPLHCVAQIIERRRGNGFSLPGLADWYRSEHSSNKGD